MQRSAKVERNTNETRISVNLNLDGSGESSISTGTKFLNHMIQSLSTHSLIDIKLRANGDLKHHIVEDVAIAIGTAISKALGNRSGIKRFGSAYAPMDESLAFVSLDLVKRPCFVSKDIDFDRDFIEDLAREDLRHFFISLCVAINCTMHIQVMYGTNDHHKAEACFKSLALALREAIARDRRRLAAPSSKGTM